MKTCTGSLFSKLLFSLLITSASAFAQEANVIAVNGTGTAKMEVDTAYINGAVVTQAKAVTEAQAANAKIFNTAHDEITSKFGLGEKDFASTTYSISRVYRYPPNAPPVLIGFSVRHGFSVKVSKLDDLGAIIDNLGARGVDLVESVTFSNSDKKKYELQALTAAMQDAQANADTIAHASGRAISKVLGVTYQPVYTPNDTVSRDEIRGAKEAGTEIVPGDLDVVVNVSVKYLFQ